MRRVAVRYEPRADILRSPLHLACSLIDRRYLTEPKRHGPSRSERAQTDVGVPVALVACAGIGQGDSTMQMLAELFRYNVWANRRIVDACAALSADQLRTPRADVYGSILDTLSHLISVEYNYLRLIRGEPTVPQRFDAVAAARERCQETDRAYIEFVERLDELGLGRSFRMEGLGRDMTVGQGLLQVATHSIQHRADLASAVSRSGVEPPGLDYVHYLAEGQS